MTIAKKVTINLVPQALAALEATMVLTGENQTDEINRALQIAHEVHRIQASGGEILVREKGATRTQRVVFH